MNHYYQTIGENWFSYPQLYSAAINNAITGSKFVEVGCWKGRSAIYMAVELINSKKNIDFYCVDVWKYLDTQKDIDEKMYDNLYETFLKNIEPVKNHIKIIRKKSNDAANDFDNNSLDFVFIDAAHDYDNVSNDIKSWLPKVKSGGVLAGHDYEYIGVERAVNEILGKSNIISKEKCWIFNKK